MALRVPNNVGAIGAARAAIYLSFFNVGAGAGLWAVFIPVVQDRISISDGVLGLVLLSAAAGAILAMPATGWGIGQFGSRPISRIAAMVMPFGAALPLLAPSLPLLFGATFLMGASAGILDVSMNNEAARLEGVHGRPLMSGFHGLYSVGGLVGAGLAAALVGLGPSGAWGAAGILAVLAVAAILVRHWYYPAGERPTARFRFSLPSRALLGLGALAFLCFGLEGAVADWSAVLLVSTKGATPELAASAFGAFAAAMATMRFLGDRLVLRFGRPATLGVGGALIMVGCAVAVLSPWPIVSAAGFGIIGIGAANVVPVLLSTSARFPPGSGGVSAVATMGYVGTLTWPPLIGGLSHVVGLPTILWMIGLAGLVIAFGAGLVRPR